MLQTSLIQAGLPLRGSWPLTTRWAMASQITRVAISEVMSLMSYGGDTSTIARPHTGTLRTISSSSLRASRGSRPPGSGQPVPGTKPASMQSMSKEM